MSTAASKQSKATALAGVQALIAGTQKYFPNASFTIGGTAYTTASLIQVLQGLADGFAAANSTHTAAKDALTDLRTLEAKVTPLLRGYRSFVRVSLGNAATTLADFGLKPAKAPTPLTGEQRAAATAKARATRTARGTTSKKQKLAIQGDVTGVVVTPITHSTPSPSPAPAPGVAAPVEPAPAVTPKP
jgi:hypothetical protein